jgi:16S rRNA (cytosine1402-N4)-methyltransferase
MTDFGHKSVLLQEVIAGLDIHSGDIVVDGTLGSGGHTEEVLKLFGSSVRIIAIDADRDALDRSKTRLSKYGGNITFVENNFRNIDTILDEQGISNVQRILLDIGLSSNQLEESGRGFSFQKEEPLAMTFKKDPQEGDITAATILNEWGEETIATILYGFGEERYSKRIARGIVEAREVEPITTTTQLVTIIMSSTPTSYHHMRIHPATRTFQALRIAVNEELQVLKEGILKALQRLSPGGRLAVISFHSLEDRIVKQFFKQQHEAGIGLLITKKPIVSNEDERMENPRARSAKLRIIEKI